MSSAIDIRDNKRDKSFQLPVYCRNCDFRGEVQISKGADSNHRIRHTDCPNCGATSFHGLTRSYRANQNPSNETGESR